MAAVVLLGVAPAPVGAHPLGNYSINQYFLVDLRGEQLEVYYLLDLAEIPSFAELDLLDTDFDSVVSRQEEDSYLGATVPALVEKIRLDVDGQAVPLEVVDRRLALAEGSAAMVVINILVKLAPATFEWPEAGAAWEIAIASENHQEAVGIRECKLLIGERFIDQTEERDRKRLGYQTRVFVDAGQNPVYQDFDAEFLLHLGPGSGAAVDDRSDPVFGWTATARAARDSGDRLMERAFGEVYDQLADNSEDDVGAAAAPTPRPVMKLDRPADAGVAGADQRYERPAKGDEGSVGILYDRVSSVIRAEQITPAMFVLGLAIATVLGAAHARSPGHGKTVMAAYLVGERGTVGHAILLGLVVTATHTWSVLALGLVTLSLRDYVAEETLSFWMGIASGTLIVVIGVVLFLRRYKAYILARRNHEHGHGHTHVVAAQNGQGVSYWSILGLGFSGGIVPCPTALIVLLLAIRFGRLGYGLLLILAFSFGLALVLVAIGVLVVRASGLVRRVAGSDGRLQLLSVVSSSVIVLLGLWVVVWTLLSYNVIVFRPGG
jgi:ABC-type nickel/cobalt efflux system permease component RcnA